MHATFAFLLDCESQHTDPRTAAIQQFTSRYADRFGDPDNAYWHLMALVTVRGHVYQLSPVPDSRGRHLLAEHLATIEPAAIFLRAVNYATQFVAVDLQVAGADVLGENEGTQVIAGLRQDELLTLIHTEVPAKLAASYTALISVHPPVRAGAYDEAELNEVNRQSYVRYYERLREAWVPPFCATLDEPHILTYRCYDLRPHPAATIGDDAAILFVDFHF